MVIDLATKRQEDMHLLVKEEHHRVSYITKDGKIGCKGFQQNKGINYIDFFVLKVKFTKSLTSSQSLCMFHQKCKVNIKVILKITKTI